MNLFGVTLPISRLKLNLLANFAGQGWSALMGLAFIPLYIRFMGIEAYGLVGFYLTLQGILQILDFGLSPTMNREMARYSVQPERAAEARDFVRTLEVGYWVLGLGIGLVIWLVAPFVATHWIKASELPIPTIVQALRLMGVLSALQWPLSFYQGGLMGLQRQAAFNALQIIMSTLSNGGVILILWLVAPTITAFLTWQIVVNALRVGMITLLLWRSLPASEGKPRFTPGLFINKWRFAAGMSGITFFSLILTQTDKIILSKILGLDMFGYYTIAGMLAGGLTMITSAIVNTIFPSFSALATIGDEVALKRLYHRTSQLMAVLILPLSAVGAFFAFDIMYVWSGSAETARNAAPIAGLLLAGTALNSLMSIPYILQLAYGWTSLGLRIILLLILCLTPATIVMTIYYGPVGAAGAWAALNILYMLVGLPLTHRRLLKGEAWLWMRQDIAPPLMGAIIVAGIGRELLPTSISTPITILRLGAILLGTLTVAGLASAEIRLWVLHQLTRLRTRYA